MIDINKTIDLINIALKETDNVVEESSYLTYEHVPIAETIIVLKLLKEAILNNPKKINERILRGTHDLGIYAFKSFENTKLEDAICDVTEVLYKKYSNYKKLEPLDLDFGKGSPI